MPLTPEQTQLLDELERTTDQAVSLFGKFIKTHETAVFNELIDLLNRLDFGKGNTILISIENLKKVNRIVLDFRKALVSKEYVSQVANFAAFFRLTAGIQNAYFNTIKQNFSPSQLLAFVLNDTIADTSQALIGAGIDANLMAPLKAILQQNISTGGTLAQLRSQLSVFIKGDANIDGRLLRYTKQLTTDAINQFNANYMQTVTDDLGLEWYFYKGSLLKTSRPFCESRANKYFHKSEVQSWAGLNWSGKIKGTTQTTIFVYRGGYNCGHLLVPVHELAVPKDVIARNK